MYRKILRSAAVCLLLAVMLSASASAVTIGGGTVTGSSVRLRANADTSGTANVIRELNKNAFLLVEEKLPGWYKVVCDGVEGYVSADYVSFSETLDGAYNFSGAETAGTCINLRSGASTAQPVVKNLAAKGTKLTVAGVSGSWLKVQDVFGAVGYIRSDFVRYESAAAGAAAAAGQTTGEQLAQTAQGYLGYSYVYGGASPKTGFDCSGFVNYIYGLYGYDLERVAQDIYSSNGVSVSRDALQPGDVLCFGWGAASVNHVGIYIGGGEMVHASTSSTGVITSDINSAYYTAKFVGAKRILG